MTRTILLGLGIAAFAQDTLRVGDWLISKGKDPMDDTARVLAILPSDNPEVFLALACAPELAVFIDWGNGLSGGPQHEIQIRVPPTPSVTQQWTTGSGVESLLARDPVDFVRVLILAAHPNADNALMVRTRTRRGRVMTAAFGIDRATVVEMLPHLSCLDLDELRR